MVAMAPGARVEAAGGGPVVGIVFDVGGRGDKSFNDGAYLGGARAADSLGARVRYIEPGEGSDREAGLRLLAAEGMDLVMARRVHLHRRPHPLAREYPNVKFAGVDYAVPTDSAGNALPPPPNLVALKFREEEGSFLVGALAALVGGSKKVGFVGGMDIALIHKFEAGYRAGVKHVCPDCEVLVQYAGVTPEAFKQSRRRARSWRSSQYQQRRERHLPRLRLHGARRVRGGAHQRQAGDRRGRRPVRRSARPRADLDGERHRCGGLRRRRSRCRTAPSRAASGCSGSRSTASATSTTTTIARSFPIRCATRLQAARGATSSPGRIAVPSTR